MKVALAALVGSVYIAVNDLLEIQLHRSFYINPVEIAGTLALGVAAWRWSR